MEDRFITLAIHTSSHAMALSRILESHGIEVRVQKFVISGAPIAAGIRIMIRETDLPLALKITESIEQINTANLESILSGHSGDILIPVDFNDYAILACKTGFDLAKRLKLRPVILHAYPTPYFNTSFSLDETINGGLDPSLEQEVEEVETARDLKNQGNRQMKDLIKRIEKEQAEGSIPELKFKTLLEPGVAEDVIKDYCRLTPPSLVVMVTRGKEKKGEQLIGSVTAEVLDVCKVPVLSVPENGSFTSIDKVKKLVFFCNLDQHDLISVDTFMRMFDYPECEITLIPINEKTEKSVKSKLDNLKNYFNKTYPASHFKSVFLPQKTFMLDFYNYETQASIDMIVVPNRRKNAFMRIFNPGIAHRLLFERDLPLLALPI